MLADLAPRGIDGTLWDDGGDGLARHLPSQRPTGTMATRPLLGAMALGLAAPPIAPDERTPAEFSHASDLPLESLAPLA